MVVIEEALVWREDEKLHKLNIPEQKISSPVRERDDDWFLLLDLVPTEAAFVPPGTLLLQRQYTVHVKREVFSLTEV